MILINASEYGNVLPGFSLVFSLQVNTNAFCIFFTPSILGRFHECCIETCSCKEAIAATYLRNNLWPSSASRPTMGFHMEFMKWVKYLIIEAHTSLQAICQTVRWKNNLSVQEVSLILLISQIVFDCILYINDDQAIREQVI